MQNEERYKLFVPLLKPIGTCDHIGPSPAYDSTTQELLGYRVGLYKGHTLRGFHRVEGKAAEIFPLEAWEHERNEALALLQK